MKTLILLCAAALWLSACDNSGEMKGNGTREAEVVLPVQDEGPQCFQKISGAGMHDTTRVRLDPDGSGVSGTMDIILHEKDSRRGRLRGTLGKDGIIRADYYFMQEGMTDTVPLQFRLEEDAILLRPAIYDPATGRERPDTSKGFADRLNKVACQ